MDWRDTLNAQLSGIQFCQSLMNHSIEDERETTVGHDIHHAWQADYLMLSQAQPYAWSADTIRACLEASRSIPEDTTVDLSFLKRDLVEFWYFGEHPLPYPPAHDDEPITGITLAGKLLDEDDCQLHTYTGTTIKGKRYPLAPSQISLFRDGKTFAALREEALGAHDRMYRYGRFKEFYKNDDEREAMAKRFSECSIGLLKFIVAANVWMNQKVVQIAEESGERARRREFERTTKTPAPKIKVVRLRRMEHHTTPTDGEPSKREFSCRWVVDGHWRNQPFGPKKEQRRLQFIHPYVKGPQDKPLHVHEKKVMVVDR